MSYVATSSPQADAAKAEAEAILSLMQTVKFDKQPAIEENDTVTTVLKDTKAFVRPLDALTKDLGKVHEQIAEVKDKLKDLRNQSDHSIATSRKANEIGNKIKDAKFSTKLGVLETRSADMTENIENAIKYNLEVPQLIEDLRDSYVNLGMLIIYTTSIDKNSST